MKKLTFYLLPVIAILFNGCNNSGQLTQLMEERDSLRNANEMQAIALNNYAEAIDIVTSTLDSISEQDQLIFVGHGELPVTRDDVLSNLSRFENIMKKQQNRIKSLEAALAQEKDSLNSSLILIEHLKEQIEFKNRQIAQLKNDIENKNISIEQLQKQVESQNLKISSQSATINQLTNQNQRQNEALARQDAILNHGYLLIGSKDDLKRKGIIKNGKLVADGLLDRTKFARIDIRVFREVNFTAKKPKILTNMSTSSYELTTDGNKNFTLRITNPADFWKVSNYLVIVTH